MARVFNFSAGPATLPEEVLTRAREELLDWGGLGMSVMEMSHRSKAFIGVAETAEADLRELLAIPDSYKVLFLQGGATLQFSAVALNLAATESAVDYAVTGSWSKRPMRRVAGSPTPISRSTSRARKIPADRFPLSTSGRCPRTRRISTIARTRRLPVSSSRSFRKTARSRSSAICRRHCCRGRSTLLGSV